MGPVIKKSIGPEAELSVSIEDGNVLIGVDYQGKLAGASLAIEIEAVQLIDAITDAIPGEMDDAIIDSLAKKLLAKKTG